MSTSTPAPSGPRATRPQAVLSVTKVEEITPNLIRITAGGEGYEALNDNDSTDKYVKILFADPRHGLVPPYDLVELRENSPEKLPRNRTYTLRNTDAEAQSLTIDFVVHGDEGLAGPWAKNAQIGDTLVISGAGGNYYPQADSDWHLLIADHTAIPAVSSALEAMTTDAKGVLIASVPHAEDRLLPEVPAGIKVLWTDSDAELLETLNTIEWQEGTPQVFAHGERESIKAVRKILKAREVPRESLSISAYWARGRVEDQFQAEKREPIGQID